MFSERSCLRFLLSCLLVVPFIAISEGTSKQLAHAYNLPDTGQTKCYDNTQEIPCPESGEPFYGQDAQYQRYQPAYQDNGDGTVTDLNTGLTWQQGDEQNTSTTRRNWIEAADYCDTLYLGEQTDWRLPSLTRVS